jgi:hypothetical protein
MGHGKTLLVRIFSGSGYGDNVALRRCAAGGDAGIGD